MPSILPLSQKVQKKITKHRLEKKWDKQAELFTSNPLHPSLNTELMAPKEYGVYSFRIDRKFRALFIYRPDSEYVEIISITLHYQ